MRAFLVVGPESSGTRFLTGLLIDGGCKGNDTHAQLFDQWKFDNHDPIVWRRSFPWTVHHWWPNIELDLVKPLRTYGYTEIMILVTSRDWFALWQSQADPKNRHAPNEAEALRNISLAYQEIFRQLSVVGLPFLVVHYEALIVYGERAVRPLLRKLGLNADAPLRPIDGTSNARYYP